MGLGALVEVGGGGNKGKERGKRIFLGRGCRKMPSTSSSGVRKG